MSRSNFLLTDSQVKTQENVTNKLMLKLKSGLRKLNLKSTLVHRPMQFQYRYLKDCSETLP